MSLNDVIPETGQQFTNNNGVMGVAAATHHHKLIPFKMFFNLFTVLKAIWH